MAESPTFPEFTAFLDESGQREYGQKTDKYFVVAGSIVSTHTVDTYEVEFNGLKRSFFGSTQVEIKSNWLRQPKEAATHYLEPYGISEAKLKAFTESVYDWILATEIVFLAGVVDKDQMKAQYSSPHNPSAVAYNIFLQRYQKFLVSHRCNGSVILDDFTGATKAGNQWKDLLLRQHSSLLKSGCPYTRLQFNNIHQDLLFKDSAGSSILQDSDLVCYNTFRQFKEYGHIWDDPNSKSLPVYSYFNRMLPRFDQSPKKVFAGFGVAKMPTMARHNWLI